MPPNNIDQFVIEFAAANTQQESDNNNNCDDENAEAKKTIEDEEDTTEKSANRLTSESLVANQDTYEFETKEEKLKRLLAELEDDKDITEALERRKADARLRKITMTEEMKNESLRKIQDILKRGGTSSSV